MKTYSFLYLKNLKIGVLKIKFEILEILEMEFWKIFGNFGSGILKISLQNLEIYFPMVFKKQINK